MISRHVQRLFIRFMRLNLLLGISMGMWMALIGIRAYNFVLKPVLFFDWPLGPLQIVLNGAMFVCYGELTYLRSQLPFSLRGIRAPKWALVKFQRRFFNSVGLFFAGLGLELLISKPLKFPDPALSSIQQVLLTIFLVSILLGIISINWYLYLRDKRRAVPGEQGG